MKKATEIQRKHTPRTEEEVQKLNGELLKNIKNRLPELEELLRAVNEDHTYGDLIYRFYHGSFKVYWIQDTTLNMVKILKELAPKGVKKFNWMFEEILKKGTGKKFSEKHNASWVVHTRPMVEAFFHAKYFLEQAVKFGKELEEAPTCLPSGWAGLLYFYNLR